MLIVLEWDVQPSYMGVMFSCLHTFGHVVQSLTADKTGLSATPTKQILKLSLIKLLTDLCFSTVYKFAADFISFTINKPWTQSRLSPRYRQTLIAFWLPYEPMQSAPAVDKRAEWSAEKDWPGSLYSPALIWVSWWAWCAWLVIKIPQGFHPCALFMTAAELHWDKTRSHCLTGRWVTGWNRKVWITARTKKSGSNLLPLFMVVILVTASFSTLM